MKLILPQKSLIERSGASMIRKGKSKFKKPLGSRRLQIWFRSHKNKATTWARLRTPKKLSLAKILMSS